MTEIKIIGPAREHMPEWEDPDTGEVLEACDVHILIAEALGTDGQVHMMSATMGLELHPDVEAVYRGTLEAGLRHRMREMGVWSHDPA
jgi:hypothetical protein